MVGSRRVGGVGQSPGLAYPVDREPCIYPSRISGYLASLVGMGGIDGSSRRGQSPWSCCSLSVGAEQDATRRRQEARDDACVAEDGDDERVPASGSRTCCSTHRTCCGSNTCSQVDITFSNVSGHIEIRIYVLSASDVVDVLYIYDRPDRRIR